MLNLRMKAELTQKPIKIVIGGGPDRIVALDFKEQTGTIQSFLVGMNKFEFHTFLTLAWGALSFLKGFILLEEFKGRNIHTRLNDLSDSLINVTEGLWDQPVEKMRYHKRSRLNIASDCQWAFNLQKSYSETDAIVNALHRKIKANWPDLCREDDLPAPRTFEERFKVYPRRFVRVPPNSQI